MPPSFDSPPPYTAIDPYASARDLHQRLDSERPSELICYDCGVYHRRLSVAKRSLYVYPVDCRNAKIPTTWMYFERCRTQVAAVHVLRIPVAWLHVHQAMRALRYSPRHGTPILDRYRDGRLFGIQAFWNGDSKAVLVDGRLLLRVRAFREISHIWRQNSQFYFHIFTEFICPHARETYLYERHQVDEIMEACKALCDDPERRERFVHKRRRCGCCPSEYVIEIIPREEFDARGYLRRRKDSHRWVMCIYHYMDFGHCHSPDEPEWRALSTWPAKRPKGDWGPTQELENRPKLDLTHMELISSRFERELQQSAPPET